MRTLTVKLVVLPLSILEDILIIIIPLYLFKFISFDKTIVIVHDAGIKEIFYKILQYRF